MNIVKLGIREINFFKHTHFLEVSIMHYLNMLVNIVISINYSDFRHMELHIFTSIIAKLLCTLHAQKFFFCDEGRI